MTKLLTVLCLLIGLAMVAFGIFGLLAPLAVLPATGLDAEGVQGLSEARSIYGGMFVPMGAIVLYGLYAPSLRTPLLLSIGLIFLGVLVARAISAVLDGYTAGLNQSIISEVIITFLILAGSRPGPKRADRSA